MVLQFSTRIIQGSVFLSLKGKTKTPVDAGPLCLYKLGGTRFLVFPRWVLEKGIQNGILKYSNDCIGKQKAKFLCFSPGIIWTWFLIATRDLWWSKWERQLFLYPCSLIGKNISKHEMWAIIEGEERKRDISVYIPPPSQPPKGGWILRWPCSFSPPPRASPDILAEISWSFLSCLLLREGRCSRLTDWSFDRDDQQIAVEVEGTGPWSGF